jgi:deazaflavin-dependent oxidoreductase (nitroreductase family)
MTKTLFLETTMATEPSARQLPDWIVDHMRKYVETNGKQGHIWNGVPTLLLTTTGRRSGKSLMLPLIYGKDGDRYLIVASKGGAPEHPAWYVNLHAAPNVQVQVGADKFAAKARTATKAERPDLWNVMTKTWPAYDDYQAKTTREIPLVVLERA